jgi:MFS family permease
LSTTYRTLLGRGRLRLVVALTVMGSLLLQGMIEFGPLWLVALAVPAFLYGPHWAGLTAALGLGGVLGSQGWLTRRWAAVAVAVAAVGCCLVLATIDSVGAVVAAQVVLVLLVVAVGIPVSRRLHDAVPSSIRAGVASGVGTLTWLMFVPFALMIGFIANRTGIADTGWLLVALAAVAGVLIVVVLPGPSAPRFALEAEPPAFEADRFLPPEDPDWPGHWAVPPVAWQAVDGADGERARAEVRAAIAEMPAELREVIVLRDVQGCAAADVQRQLELSPEDERARLHRARGIVRARLERILSEGGPA